MVFLEQRSLAGLRSTPGTPQGRYRKKTITCRSCKQSWTHYEEKETDVNIATAIVADAAAKRMESALVVSADSDLVPAVKAARNLNPDLFGAAASPPKRYSAELSKLMPSSPHIGNAKVRDSQLPTVVTDTSGRTYERPVKWT